MMPAIRNGSLQKSYQCLNLLEEENNNSVFFPETGLNSDRHRHRRNCSAMF